MAEDIPAARFKRCPVCGRALPSHSQEEYCSNDGTRLITACPACQAAITSPYARYCTRCGAALQQSGGREP